MQHSVSAFMQDFSSGSVNSASSLQNLSACWRVGVSQTHTHIASQQSSKVKHLTNTQVDEILQVKAVNPAQVKSQNFVTCLPCINMKGCLQGIICYSRLSLPASLKVHLKVYLHRKTTAVIICVARTSHPPHTKKHHTSPQMATALTLLHFGRSTLLKSHNCCFCCLNNSHAGCVFNTVAELQNHSMVTLYQINMFLIAKSAYILSHIISVKLHVTVHVLKTSCSLQH